MKETKPDALFEGWLALPEAQRKPMDAAYQDIFELSCEKGFRAIIDEARWQPTAQPCLRGDLPLFTEGRYAGPELSWREEGDGATAAWSQSSIHRAGLSRFEKW